MDDIDPAHGLWFACDNVWLWMGRDGAGVPEHVDKRVGDVSMVCMVGSRRFQGFGVYDPIDMVMKVGDRVTFDSNRPHSVDPGEGECVLMCCGDQ